ncbi:YopX family protein [Flavobacterium crassostreae]|uniref:YopX family protein n=1 Tax=Flavobacterium crassostreae TaxID=1763534 RepID=UPI0008A4AFE6|nr:YopX family protein [Flavobacterium crassostreae]
MTRLIKFKGKTTDTNEWVYGYLMGKDIIGDFMNHYFVIPKTVSQFTGKIDKNGVDIYENDICNANYFKLHIVDFWQNGFHFKCSRFESHHTFSTAKHTFEVVGNIFDNADLIANRSGCH